MTSKVFAFTIKRQFESKSFRNLLIIIAAICLLAPAILMALFDKPEVQVPSSTNINSVYCVDLTEYEKLDWMSLRNTGNPVYEKIYYEDCGNDIEKAAELAKEDVYSLVLVLEREDEDSEFTLRILKPKGTELESDDVDAYITNLGRVSSTILAQKSGIGAELTQIVDGSIDVKVAFVTPEEQQAIQVAEGNPAPAQTEPASQTEPATLTEPAAPASSEAGNAQSTEVPAAEPAQTSSEGEEHTITVTVPAAEAETPGLDGESSEIIQGAKQTLAFLLPYLNIMVLYFMVLFFGQGVSNCILLEKNNKLMDTFLVNVKTNSLIIGKVFAVVATALMEIAIWIVCLVAGAAGGVAIVKALHPGYMPKVEMILTQLSSLQGLFSPAGILPAALLICFGFVLYCGLASISGCLASKQEDLASTQTLFTLTLVLSFMVVLFNGGINGDLKSTIDWMDIVPFTAVLVTPSKLLLGTLSPLWGFLACLITLAFSIAVMVGAAKLYRLMVFYKGNVPKVKDIPKLLRTKG